MGENYGDPSSVYMEDGISRSFTKEDQEVWDRQRLCMYAVCGGSTVCCL